MTFIGRMKRERSGVNYKTINLTNMRNYELLSMLRYLKLELDGPIMFRDLAKEGFVGNWWDWENVKNRNAVYKEIGTWKKMFSDIWK